jgi:DNA polymerase sigma
MIVKFFDRNTGIRGDINANERLGYLNSKMIKHYCDISTILRPMLRIIKMWAKPLGLNTPGRSEKGKSVTFSSYAFALMTISFLQVTLGPLFDSCSSISEL